MSNAHGCIQNTEPCCGLCEDWRGQLGFSLHFLPLRWCNQYQLTIPLSAPLPPALMQNTVFEKATPRGLFFNFFFSLLSPWSSGWFPSGAVQCGQTSLHAPPSPLEEDFPISGLGPRSRPGQLVLCFLGLQFGRRRQESRSVFFLVFPSACSAGARCCALGIGQWACK